jgi:hypothetical protein
MYEIFDVSIQSDIELPELAVQDNRKVIVHVEAGPSRETAQLTPQWFYEWRDTDGETYLLSAKVRNSYLLRFPGVIDFLVSFPEGSTGATDTEDGTKAGRIAVAVQYFPEAGVPEYTTRHLLLDQILPRVLSHLGHLILHASAIKLENGEAVIFMGETGQGKSTLASSFYINGYPLVTDDCLLIKFVGDKVVCVPNYSGLRLYPDSHSAIFAKRQTVAPVAHYSTKERLAVAPIVSQPIPVNSIFLLTRPDIDDSDIVGLEKIRGAEEIMSIISQAFLLDTKDNSVIIKQFSSASKFNSLSPPMFKLNYSCKYELLDRVRDTILKTAQDPGKAGC